LNLLTRNGVVFTAFKSALSADQYSRLLEIANMAETDSELREAVAGWANSEKLAVRFEE